MLQSLIVAEVLIAVFVGYNIGGSSTGVAFGPAVGSRLVRKAAAALFSVFAFLGARTVGRNVIATISEGIVPAAQFTPVAGVGVFHRPLAARLERLWRPRRDLDDGCGGDRGPRVRDGLTQRGTRVHDRPRVDRRSTHRTRDRCTHRTVRPSGT